MKNSTANSSTSKYVTTTTVRDKVQHVEKVVFDNRIKRKNVLALNEKVAALREYEKRPIYKRIGRMFHCSPDQIKRIVQQKEAILSAWEQRTRKCRDAKTLEMKVVRVSMLGKAVYEWIRRMMYYKDILITDGLIQKMAIQFKSAMGLQNFFPHQEWCDKFRTTYNISGCDSKALTIGYTQGHSVQIKDVMKDVLYECCPREGDEDNNETDDAGDDEEDDDCMSIESNEDISAKVQINNNSVEQLKTNRSKTIVMQPKTSILPSATMPGIRQLVGMPIQGNGLNGQKVLVATPIVQPGQKQTGPMTMTIIPIATLGQSSNKINAVSVGTTLKSNSFNQISTTKNNNNNNDDDIPIPTPIMEIKKEIKEEPRDIDETVDEAATQEAQTEDIKIKREYLTDDEDDVQPTNKQSASAPTAMPTFLPAPLVSIPLHNRDMLEESSKDSLDDLTLSSLRKRIKIEESSTDQEDNEKVTRTRSKTKTSNETHSTTKLPPMPPLTKAPTINASIASSSSSIRSTASTSNCHSSSSANKLSSRKRVQSSDPYSGQETQAIRSCSEARKYLKLLEEFALERENFRLIGLITRADEVLRELDRKENNDNGDGDNEDVDVD